MGRPSVLSDNQWAEIDARLMKGEKLSDLANEFDVSKSIISRKLSQRVAEKKILAQQLASVEVKVGELPVFEQIGVRTLADTLKLTSAALANAAHSGAVASERLFEMGAESIDALDKSKPAAENEATLLQAAKLFRTGKEAAQLGIDLLAINKGVKLPEPPKQVPKDLPKDPDEAVRTYIDFMSQ